MAARQGQFAIGDGRERELYCRQHKFGKCVPKALRSYLQVPSLMSHHYLEVNPIRLGGKIRMALGAQHASPCAPGRRRARIALETQPLPAALPAAVLRIALGLSITQRAARYSCGRSGHCANRTHLYIARSPVR